jgi:hypothetical protein
MSFRIFSVFATLRRDVSGDIFFRRGMTRYCIRDWQGDKPSLASYGLLANDKWRVTGQRPEDDGNIQHPTFNIESKTSRQ